MSAALVLHNDPDGSRAHELAWGRRYPEIVNEREARALAVAFCEGANLVATRLASALFPEMSYSDAWLAFVRQHGEPTYTQIRIYLTNDCNVAPLVAQRVALSLTEPLRHTT